MNKQSTYLSEVASISTDAKHYRPDIDGLRGIAILPVMLFHADLGIFNGGFIGVDVFFVISGYLITTIILHDQEQDAFSILQFYERRVRRIMPALIVVVGCSFIVALVVMAPDELAAFAKTAVSLMFFGSNVLFWREQGYFTFTAEAIPLLHTWSLAVEEQFYAVFPIAMILIRKHTASRVCLLFGIMAAVSLGFSIWAIKHHPMAAFYLAPSRAWELLIGSLLAFGIVPSIGSKIVRHWLSLVGLLLIIFPMLMYSSLTPFPGVAAIPPTLGTAILIQAGASGDSWMRRLLAARPLVAIGLVSYSLYLWHWPLLAFAHIAHPHRLDSMSKCGVLALTGVLATLTWFFIERPFRQKMVCSGRRQLMSAAMGSVAIVLTFSLFVIRNDGILGQFDAATRSEILANIAAKGDWLYPAECGSNFRRMLGPNDSVVYCSVPGGGTSSEILFWGDSMLEQLYPLISEIVREGSMLPHRVVFVTSGGCPPIVGLNRAKFGYDCDTFNRRVLEQIQRSDVKTIVMGGNIDLESDIDRANKWKFCKADSGCQTFVDQDDFLSYANRQLGDQLSLLTAAGRHIVIFLPFPDYGQSIPDYLNRKLLSGEPPNLAMTRAEHAAHFRGLANLWKIRAAAINATVIDPSESLCPSGECVYRQGHVSIYKDGLHLTSDGVRMLKTPLLRALVQH